MVAIGHHGDFAAGKDAAGAAALGYRAALVGEALMRDPDPSQRLAEMIAAGRNMATPREARG